MSLNFFSSRTSSRAYYHFLLIKEERERGRTNVRKTLCGFSHLLLRIRIKEREKEKEEAK
jgi:hypothetical protein